MKNPEAPAVKPRGGLRKAVTVIKSPACKCGAELWEYTIIMDDPYTVQSNYDLND